MRSSAKPKLPSFPAATAWQRSWQKHWSKTGLPGYELPASADGEFAALVFDGGRQGLVVDLAPFRVALRLDGGDYYQNTVPFSACFLSFQGDTVLVHRTAWNRLDASDPRSGRLLTARGPTSYENGERPPHYLDYFHGLLRPSPSGTLLFDAGWVWQPAGVPCVFDAAAWHEAGADGFETGLRQALANNDLSLHFQPLVDTRSKRLRAGEALLRWRHPTLGELPFGRFKSSIDDPQLIAQLGDWTLNSACRSARTWLSGETPAADDRDRVCGAD